MVDPESDCPIDPESDCPIEPSTSEQTLEPLKSDESSREAKSWQRKGRPSDHLPMGWRPFLQFLDDNNERLVEPYQFSTAAKAGSVDPLVEVAYSTPVGDRLGTGFTQYMAQAHLAGEAWAGELERSDMMVSTVSTCLCMIDKFPCYPATHVNIKKDLCALVERLFKLYEVKGRFPCYFNDLIKNLLNPPEDEIGVGNNLEALILYYTKIVNDPALAK
jgi:hypothetical protein